MANDVTFPTPQLPGAETASPPWRVPEPPRRFQHVIWKHVLLFLLTLATTTLAGAEHYAAFLAAFRPQPIPFTWGLAMNGLWYSVTILGILGFHEMGHYLACRYYGVDATLPFFLPLPGVLTGTLGAVIRIRESFPTRRVLFDIGVAGPIAGFVVLVPALFYGLTLSTVVPEPTSSANLIYLGEPLLFQWAASLTFGTVPQGYTLNMHPVVFACWFGMLATAINLLPFGQMDGGHISYATLGRWSTPISIATVGSAVLMTVFVTRAWWLITVMMVVMLFLLGPRHPRVIYEHEPVGRGRHLVAAFALIILVVCFTPVPIRFPG